MRDPVVEEVKRRTDVVELVSGRVTLKKTGRYYKGLCPFHHERTPSFVVYPENGTYHCFGCHTSGDVFAWLMETEKLTFGEALRELARRAGVALPERQAAAERAGEREREQGLSQLVSLAADQFHRWLTEGVEGEPARSYLTARGVSLETAQRFRIGYAPDRWDLLTKLLVGQGHEAEQLVGVGLAIEGERGLHDRFRGRLIFPIADARGQVRGFGGRVLGGDGQPKYLNSPQTPLFDKSALLYALDAAIPFIRQAEQAVIVEGYMDAVIAHQHSFTSVVASMGTAVTERQLDLLKRYTTRFVLALDADEAGAAATDRGLEVVQRAMDYEARPVPTMGIRGLIRYEHVMKGEVWVAILPQGRDPDDVIRADPERLRQLIQNALPLVEYALQSAVRQADISSAKGKSEAAHRVLPLIRAIPDAVERGHYVQRLARALGVPERDLISELRRTRSAGPPATNGRKRAASVEAPATRGEALEDHYLAMILLAPELAGRPELRPAATEFGRPEARAVFQAVLEWSAQGSPGSGAQVATEQLRLRLDPALHAYYDELLERGARLPPAGRGQLEAGALQTALRLRERKLREQLRYAQLMLKGETDEGPPAVEQLAAGLAVGEPTRKVPEQDAEAALLRQQVKALSDSLMRVQLALSRLPLYSSASS